MMLSRQKPVCRTEPHWAIGVPATRVSQCGRFTSDGALPSAGSVSLRSHGPASGPAHFQTHF